MTASLPFQLKDYISLVEWTGRIIREDKCGFTPTYIPPILNCIDVEPESWLKLTLQFEQLLKSLVGKTQALRKAAEILGFQRTPGLSNCRAAFL